MIKAHHQLTPQSKYQRISTIHVFCFGMMQNRKILWQTNIAIENGHFQRLVMRMCFIVELSNTETLFFGMI